MDLNGGRPFRSRLSDEFNRVAFNARYNPRCGGSLDGLTSTLGRGQQFRMSDTMGDFSRGNVSNDLFANTAFRLDANDGHPIGLESGGRGGFRFSDQFDADARHNPRFGGRSRLNNPISSSSGNGLTFTLGRGQHQSSDPMGDFSLRNASNNGPFANTVFRDRDASDPIGLMNCAEGQPPARRSTGSRGSGVGSGSDWISRGFELWDGIARGEGLETAAGIAAGAAAYGLGFGKIGATMAGIAARRMAEYEIDQSKLDTKAKRMKFADDIWDLDSPPTREWRFSEQTKHWVETGECLVCHSRTHTPRCEECRRPRLYEC